MSRTNTQQCQQKSHKHRILAPPLWSSTKAPKSKPWTTTCHCCQCLGWKNLRPKVSDISPLWGCNPQSVPLPLGYKYLRNHNNFGWKHAVKSNVIAVVIARPGASQQHHVTQQMPSLIVHLGQILHSSADFLQGQLHVLVEDLPETTEMLGQYVFTQINTKPS